MVGASRSSGQTYCRARHIAASRWPQNGSLGPRGSGVKRQRIRKRKTTVCFSNVALDTSVKFTGYTLVLSQVLQRLTISVLVRARTVAMSRWQCHGNGRKTPALWFAPRAWARGQVHVLPMLTLPCLALPSGQPVPNHAESALIPRLLKTSRNRCKPIGILPNLVQCLKCTCQSPNWLQIQCKPKIHPRVKGMHTQCVTPLPPSSRRCPQRRCEISNATKGQLQTQNTAKQASCAGKQASKNVQLKRQRTPQNNQALGPRAQTVARLLNSVSALRALLTVPGLCEGSFCSTHGSIDKPPLI